MRRQWLLFLTVLLAGWQQAMAQTRKVDTVSNFMVSVRQPKRFYLGNGLDLVMLSTSVLSKPGKESGLTVPRVTALVHLGLSFNWDLDGKFGIMSGIGLRNIGFIEKSGDSTIKRRVYSFGIPFGLKIGDLRNRNFSFFGIGLDFPLNYREKRFEKRNEKYKYNEWFGDQTPAIMPFLFAGRSFDRGFTFKLQYYPLSFLNEGYIASDAGNLQTKPNSGYRVNLLLLSLGLDIHYNQYRIQQKEYRDLKEKRAALINP